MIKTRHAARAVAALSLLLLVPAAIGASGSSAAQPGTLTSASFHSTTLGEDIAYNVYLPPATRARPSATRCSTCSTGAATR